MFLKLKLLHWIKRCFGRNAAAAKAGAAATLVTSLECSGQAGTDPPPGFVTRDAIFARDGRIAGYEFSPLAADLQAPRLPPHEEILTRMAQQGASVLGRRLAFIPLLFDAVGTLRTDLLPRKNTVLILHPGAQEVPPGTASVCLAQLKAEGFRVGLALVRGLAVAPAEMAQADFLQIDVADFHGVDLRTLTRRLRTGHGPHGRRPWLLACKVMSQDEFEFCSRCGFDFFQGDFFSGGEIRPADDAKLNRLVVLPVLSQLMSECSFGEIAAQLSREPVLSYKLLRYLNSAAMGRHKPVENLTEALMLVGRDKFYRWTSLLLFDFAAPDHRQRLLAERALTRARTLELLAGKGMLPGNADKLFLLGLFSLLDQALGRPMPALLAEVALPESVRDALLGKPGAYADALALAELGEVNTHTTLAHIAAVLRRCQISDRDFMPAAAQALTWANQMLDGGSPETDSPA